MLFQSYHKVQLHPAVLNSIMELLRFNSIFFSVERLDMPFILINSRLAVQNEVGPKDDDGRSAGLEQHHSDAINDRRRASDSC